MDVVLRFRPYLKPEHICEDTILVIATPRYVPSLKPSLLLTASTDPLEMQET